MIFDEAVEEEQEVHEAGSNCKIRKESLGKRIDIPTLFNLFIVFTIKKLFLKSLRFNQNSISDLFLHTF